MTTIKIHNVETGKVIEREMTPDELESYEANKKAVQLKREVAQKAAAAKAALLEKLGITEEEAKLLLS